MINFDFLQKLQNKSEFFFASIGIFILIISIMSPLGSDIPVESPMHDMLTHISGIVEAKNALFNGQFPIRVAPHALNGYEYPIFQFYGNFPYTLGGFLYIITDNPYFSYKLVIMFSLFLGAFYLYLFGKWTTSNKYTAFTGSVIYLTAPYILVDIHGRFAFPEIMALGLLPPIFYYTFKILYETKINDCLFLTVFLTLLFHTHNIFSEYTMIFLAIILFYFLIFNKSGILSVFHVIASISLAILVSSWYLIPQLVLINKLVINLSQFIFLKDNYLTTIWVLLGPSKILPLPVNYFDNPGLGFQIGFPLLACFACGFLCCFYKTIQIR